MSVCYVDDVVNTTPQFNTRLWIFPCNQRTFESVQFSGVRRPPGRPENWVTCWIHFVNQWQGWRNPEFSGILVPSPAGQCACSLEENKIPYQPVSIDLAKGKQLNVFLNVTPGLSLSGVRTARLSSECFNLTSFRSFRDFAENDI